MTIQQKLRNDFKKALMRKDKVVLEYLRVIIGEIQREPVKEVSDDKVVKIFTKMLKNQEQLKESGKHDIKFIEIINSYLPNPASRDEVISWINDNIDFMGLKNPLQAMKPVLQKFAGRMDGETIKEILLNMGV